jgi:hypothetical protein
MAPPRILHSLGPSEFGISVMARSLLIKMSKSVGGWYQLIYRIARLKYFQKKNISTLPLSKNTKIPSQYRHPFEIKANKIDRKENE